MSEERVSEAVAILDLAYERTFVRAKLDPSELEAVREHLGSLKEAADRVVEAANRLVVHFSTRNPDGSCDCPSCTSCE